MPIFKNEIAQRLGNWLIAANRPVRLEHPMMEDVAAGADEIERLTEELRHSEHNLANIIRTG